MSAAGCTRIYYRRSADREATFLINEKSVDPRYAIWDINVYSDPRSRFFDPYRPDRPPLPPDDPVAAQFMNKVYKIKGFHWWYHDGIAPQVSNPAWEALLPTYTEFTADGRLKLDLPTAVLLARLHNPDYQRNLEEVFLSGLDVAFERFRFDVQFFANEQSTAQFQGSEPPAILGALGPGIKNSRSVLTARQQAFIKRSFATGGELFASIANSFAFQFAGQEQNYAVGLINFTFFQPLLRQGGKAVNLEQLTRVERVLLYNLRSMAVFRQQFFRNIAVGTATDVRPQRIGGFQGGAGLSGFTGLGQGGFGGLGATLSFGTGGDRVGGSGAGSGTGLAGGGEGTVGGFYGLIQRSQAIRNTETSLGAQLLSLGLLEANFQAGLIDLVQVDEFRQNIETERANLLRARVSLQDNLENFLISTIGLPPWLPVEVDETIIKQFQFVDPELTETQKAVAVLLDRMGRTSREPTAEELRLIRTDLDAILSELPSRIAGIERELKSLRAGEGRLLADATDEERKSYDDNLRSLADSVALLKDRFNDTLRRGRAIEEGADRTANRRAADELAVVLRTASGQLQEVTLLQASIRLERVAVDPIHLSPEEAFWIARNYRMDWANRRAALVDQWRLIWFNANKLQAVLDLNVNGGFGTVGDNPARLRTPTGNMQMQVNFDAPITRKAERNIYRQSLIDYQRTRRDYIEYVDTVHLSIRARLRALERLRQNLEIQRRALAIAIRRVDQTVEDLNRPAPAAAPGQPQPQLGPTLSQNLLRALSDLRNTQDNFMSVYLGYESTRISLLIDLGILELDDIGNWVDEPVDRVVARVRDDCEIPPVNSPAYVYLRRLEEMAAFTQHKETLLEPVTPASRAFPPDDDIEMLVAESDARRDRAPRPMDWSGEADLLDLESTMGRAPSETPPPLLDQPARGIKALAHLPKRWRSRSGDELAVSRERFLKEWRRVGDLKKEGRSLNEIVTETGLPQPVVRAYFEAIDRSDLNVTIPLPTRKWQLIPGPAPTPIPPIGGPDE